MRQGRIKVVGETAVYHCISRVVGGTMLLDREAKEVFRKMLWKVAAFSGVEVLTYAVMTNHVHLLVRVCSVDESLDRAEILRRYREFYGVAPTSPNFPPPEVLAMIFAEGGEEAERWEWRLRSRMGDVSAFMKTLKQRFTIWFNQTRRRFGTIWAERFKSVLVENSAFALKTVAAYIDLNPVRAGLVKDPADYRWCGYAEAMGGNRDAQKGLLSMIGIADWSSACEAYRSVVFGKGMFARREGQGVIAEETAMRVLERDGRIASGEVFRRRIRYFTDGAILGSAEFVQAIARSAGHVTSATGAKKRLGRLPLESETGQRLVTWRKLRLDPIAPPKPRSELLSSAD